MKEKTISICIILLIVLPIVGAFIYHSIRNVNESEFDDQSIFKPMYLQESSPISPFFFNDEMRDKYLDNNTYPTDGPYSEMLDKSVEEYDFFSAIDQHLGLNDEEIEKLQENGFIVVQGSRQRSSNNFNSAYLGFFNNDLPIIITVDTILNLYHILFEDMLKSFETKYLGPTVEILLEELYNDALNEFEGSLSEDGYQRDVVLFLSVGRGLIDPGFKVKNEIADDYYEIIQKIKSASSVELYPGQDYTQYKPRGHYTQTEYLKKYFKTMMWLQRSLMDLEDPGSLSFSWSISHLLGSNQKAENAWRSVYYSTRYLIGSSDCILPSEINSASEKLFGSSSPGNINDDNLELMVEELKGEDYYRSKIQSFAIMDYEYDENSFPKQWSLMGQRYVIDADVMDNVIYNRIPLERFLPSSLDVMSALGSTRAYDILEDERVQYDYSTELQRQWAGVMMCPDSYWNQSSYYGMLDAYRKVVEPQVDPPQDFMKTEAYADKRLNTALGSYTELKHDTLLYAKQSYSNSLCEFPEVYIEPYPEMYSRLSYVCKGISFFLEDDPIGDLPDEWKRDLKTTHGEAFGELSEICQKLAKISQHVNEGNSLSNDQEEYLKNIYTGNEQCGSGHPDLHSGWLVQLYTDLDLPQMRFNTGLVSDICSAPGMLEPSVLQIATGKVDTMVVLIENRGGYKYTAVGPVYSFYEFTQPINERLTDEDWKTIEEAGSVDRPEWTSSFVL